MRGRGDRGRGRGKERARWRRGCAGAVSEGGWGTVAECECECGGWRHGGREGRGEREHGATTKEDEKGEKKSGLPVCVCVRACVRAFAVTAARRRGPERQVRTVCSPGKDERCARPRGIQRSRRSVDSYLPTPIRSVGQSLGAPALGGTTELTWTRRRRWCPESTGRIRKRARIGEAKSEMPAAIGWPLRSTNSNHSVTGYIPLPSSDLPRPLPLPRPRAPPLAVALLAPTHVHSTLSIYITHSSIYPPERAQQPAGAAPLRVSPPSCRRTHHRTCPNPPPTCQSPVPALAHSPNDARPSPRPPIDHAHAHPSRQTPCLAPILHYIPPRPSAEPALY